MFDKHQLTRCILDQLPPDDCPTFDEAFASWWMDPRDGKGMRLTTSGYQAIAVTNIEVYVFDTPMGLTLLPRHLLLLNRKLDCPYYLKTGKKPQISLFGSEQALMLTMYGDLNKFMKYLERI